MENSQAWDSLATDDDIRYCYRLLLGREPDENGRATYHTLLRARQVAISELVEMFLTSHEFQIRQTARQTGRSVVLVDLPGFQLYVSPDDWAVGKHILELHTHEPHVSATLHSVLKPGMTFVDIGANIGYFTMFAASRVGGTGHVYSFEPSPRNCSFLHMSLEQNRFTNVELYPFAAADSERLFVYDGSESNGVIAALDSVDKLSTQNVIRSVVLDKVLAGKRVDVIKIDIEGAEALALRGATQLLRTSRPIIASEFSPPGLMNYSGVSGEQYLEFLIGLGYSISVIEPSAELVDCRQDIPRIMAEFERSQASHIDILARPV